MLGLPSYELQSKVLRGHSIRDRRLLWANKGDTRASDYGSYAHVVNDKASSNPVYLLPSRVNHGDNWGHSAAFAGGHTYTYEVP